MPEKPPKSAKPGLPDTVPVEQYRELMKFVNACGGAERAYEIAKLLKAMTIPVSELIEGIAAIRKK